jgi:hypothetical protein
MIFDRIFTAQLFTDFLGQLFNKIIELKFLRIFGVNFRGYLSELFDGF